MRFIWQMKVKGSPLDRSKCVSTQEIDINSFELNIKNKFKVNL